MSMCAFQFLITVNYFTKSLNLRGSILSRNERRGALGVGGGASGLVVGSDSAPVGGALLRSLGELVVVLSSSGSISVGPKCTIEVLLSMSVSFSASSSFSGSFKVRSVTSATGGGSFSISSSCSSGSLGCSGISSSGMGS